MQSQQMQAWYINKKEKVFFRCSIAFGFMLLLQTIGVEWSDLCPQYHTYIITFMLAPLFLFCAKHMFGPLLLLCFHHHLLLPLLLRVLYASLSLHPYRFLPSASFVGFSAFATIKDYLKLLHHNNVHISVCFNQRLVHQISIIMPKHRFNVFNIIIPQHLLAEWWVIKSKIGMPKTKHLFIYSANYIQSVHSK